MIDSAPANALVEELRSSILCIDHVAIAVEDLSAAMDWYCRGLGFRMVEQRTTRGERTGMISAVVEMGGVVVVLVQGIEPESQVSRFVDAFGPGVQHLAFRVADLDHALRQVTAAGGGLDTSIIGNDGIKQVFLRRDAGSGVRIELIERSGGDFSDESVERLFRAFEVNDLY
jgi:4-hydroxyphenylpyruvate dioxygenase-like putative hemolysin